jgi:hypothetical protein
MYIPNLIEIICVETSLQIVKQKQLIGDELGYF